MAWWQYLIPLLATAWFITATVDAAIKRSEARIHERQEKLRGLLLAMCRRQGIDPDHL
ncbi:hypothetical protein [Luteimonas cucumeris]|uniref:hypothetical protein n=1 Tax=Luteimonas cucumeris TaxID=985012 RepID=UPI001315767B|nr:hypothetical protein [Luteimonas cucumeris]